MKTASQILKATALAAACAVFSHGAAAAAVDIAAGDLLNMRTGRPIPPATHTPLRTCFFLVSTGS
jgi:uncharacterized protein YraI